MDNIFKQQFPYLAQIEQSNENQKIIAFIKILLSHGLKEFILKNISNDGTVNLTGSKDFLNNFEIDLLIDITINPAELINQLKKINFAINEKHNQLIKTIIIELNNKLKEILKKK